MKRFIQIIVLFIIAVSVFQLWVNRGKLFFYFLEFRHKPARVEMTEMESGRIVIHYSRNAYIAKNIPKISKRLFDNLQQAENTLGTRLERPLHVYLFANFEEKGNYSNDIRIAHSEPKDLAVYCIENAEWDGIAERMEYQVLLQKAYGSPANPEWSEYAGSALAGVWFGKSLDDWAIFLLSSELRPEFPALFTDQQSSRFIRHPWNSILARFIKQEYGLSAMVRLYKTETLPSDYSSRWQKWLSTLQYKHVVAPPFVPVFQKGMTYAYWNSYDGGYPTLKSDRSLNELQMLGVNWIASVPYGFMRSDQAGSIAYPGHHIAGESDESLWALSENATRHGLKIMLKPQLWMHHASWPGEIHFNSQTEWDNWLNQYEKWILHYAIIAELTRTDLFCIGTELVHATLANPERWRRIIARIRQVYHGPITYAANWGQEFEQISFWDAVDYMGIDNYYPVRSTESEGLNEMKAGFERQKVKLQNFAIHFHKSILFTEIGYMANSKAGMGPKEFDADDSDYSESYQESCYRMVMETYWNEPWFAGMYWWKWFSTPDDRGRSADAHSPHGRLAEHVLKEWYAKPKPMR